MQTLFYNSNCLCWAVEPIGSVTDTVAVSCGVIPMKKLHVLVEESQHPPPTDIRSLQATAHTSHMKQHEIMFILY